MLSTTLSAARHRLGYLVTVIVSIALSGCFSGDDPPPPPLNAPSGISATSGSAAAGTSWIAVDEAKSYLVYRCPVPAGVVSNPCASVADSTCGTAIATVTVNSFYDPAPAGNPSCYKIKACRDAAGTDCGTSSAAQLASVYAPITLAAAVSSDSYAAYSGQTVSLAGSSSGATGPVSYQWTQIGGTKVTLKDSDKASAGFVAPNVTGSDHELLSFELQVSDSKGGGRAAKTAITIQPANNVVVSTVKLRDVQAYDTVSLHASGSGAVNPAAATYQWTQVSPATPKVALAGAGTANAQFKAPNVDGVSFRFKVTYTDTTTGRFSYDETAVSVTRPATQASSQPLTLPTVTPTVARQALALQGVADVTVASGQSNRFSFGVTGGTAPYRWSWSQTSGPSASLNGQTSPVLSVIAPSVTSTTTLSFLATVTDGNGAAVTGTAYLHVTSPAQTNTLTPPTIVVVPPRSAVAGGTVTFTTTLQNAAVKQTSGPVVAFTTATASTGAKATTVTVSLPATSATTTPVSFTVIGVNAAGQTVQELQQFNVLRTPSQAPPAQAPAIVSGGVPHLNAPLTLSSVGIDHADEGQAGVVIGVQASGGGGNYTYQWTYDKQPGQPDLNLMDATTSHPSFNAPGVAAKTILKFIATVTDAGQTVTTPVYVTINDLSATLTVGALADITVDGGHFVSLHAPSPSGGVPPYSFSVTQTAGTSVGTLSGNNPAFPVAKLSAGAADETLSFEYLVTDAYGNKAKVTQNVVIKAPPAPIVTVPLAATVSGPDAIDLADSGPFNLTTNVTGGVPPYTYKYEVKVPSSFFDPVIIPPTANPAMPKPTYSAGGGWTFPAEFEISMTVTDSANPPSTVRTTPHRLLFATGKQCLVCGDLDNDFPCNDMELVIADMTQCPLSKPFCANRLKPDLTGGGVTSQFKNCASLNEVKDLWWAKTASDSECLSVQADPNNIGAITKECTFACYGDGCNVDVVPPEKLIIDSTGTVSNVPW